MQLVASENRLVDSGQLPNKANMTTAEWRTRSELAVASRLSDFMGMSDNCGGFGAARIPGENAMIMRGYAQHPALVSPETLYRRELGDESFAGKFAGPVYGGVKMCNAVFSAYPEIGAILHFHAVTAAVFSGLDVELWPASQFGVMYYERLIKVPFGEVSSDSFCQNLVEALPGKVGVIFANHGIFVVGKDCAEALHHSYAIDQAMKIQIELMKSTAKPLILDHDTAVKEQPDYWGADETEDYNGTREWNDWVRLVIQKDQAAAQWFS
jgi:ribulose-5-phosphate 4-epimerase/fuculose-1-phosphate aldolase